MFISEVLYSLHRGNFSRNAFDMLTLCNEKIFEIRRKLNYWQTLLALSSENVNDIKTAFYELARSASCLVVAADNYSSYLQDIKPMVEEFIKLLLPMPVNSYDNAAMQTVDYRRQEMSERITYLISAMAGVMGRHAGEIDINSLQSQMSALGSPLDSQSIFLQYIYNHISDNNWMRLACCSDEKFIREKRHTLLKLEYHQCQCPESDKVNCAFYENMYRSITEQITVAFNVAISGGRFGISPLTFRDMLKPCVSIPAEETEQRYWSWNTYCMIKAQINGTDSKNILLKQNFHSIKGFND